MPMKPTAAVSTSASESQAFQPVPDTEPESDPVLELESDPTPDEEADRGQREHDAELVDSGGLEGSETANSQPVTPPPSSHS